MPSSPLLSLVTGSSLLSHGHCQDGKPTGRQGWVWQAQRVTSCGSYLGRASEGSQQWRDPDAEVSTDAVTQGCHWLRLSPDCPSAPAPAVPRGEHAPPPQVSLNLGWASGNPTSASLGLRRPWIWEMATGGGAESPWEPRSGAQTGPDVRGLCTGLVEAEAGNLTIPVCSPPTWPVPVPQS